MKLATKNGQDNSGYLKKKIRDQDNLLAEMKKVIRSHADVINEHAKFINTIVAQNKQLKVRLDKLEYKKPKIIIP